MAQTFVLDGLVSAGGTDGGSWSAGSGSGGTIAIETETLSGSGAVRANGGEHEVGGGGGRVAIRYDTMTLDPAHIEVRAGQGSKMDGGNGTLFLKQTSQAHGDLVVDGYDFVTQEDLCFLPGGYTFDRIFLRNRARVTADDGLIAVDALMLQSNSVLTHTIGHEAGLQVDVDRLEVDTSSAIDVTGRGYAGGLRATNAGNTTGKTLHNQPGATPYAGGSYGGVGGAASGGRSNPVYGHPGEPVYLGSGGAAGANSQPGGNGGGRIHITAGTSVTVHGILRADGQAGESWSASGGSGGSIDIDTALTSR